MKGRRPLAIFTAVVLIIELGGCAHRAPVAMPTPSPKPEPGIVGLVIAQQSADASVQRPAMVGAGEGAKAGAKTGVIAPLVPGIEVVKASRGEPRSFLLGLMLLGAGIALAPIGAGVGAAVGALTAPSVDEVERSALAMQQALADTNMPDALALGIFEAAGTRPIIPAGDPASPDVDTWLSLDPPSIDLTSRDPGGRNPDLRLRLSVQGKLLRASDGEELGTWVWAHEGPKAKFIEWGANDARLLRTELERARRAIAAQVIRDVY